jgi:hypothetical protein
VALGSYLLMEALLVRLAQQAVAQTQRALHATPVQPV